MWIFFCFTAKTWKQSFTGCCQSLLQVVTNKTHPLYSFSLCVCVWAQLFGCVQIFMASWTVVCQAPQFLGFSRQECWSELPSPTPGDISNPRIKRMTLASPSCIGRRIFTTESPGKPSFSFWRFKIVDSWRHLNPRIRSLFLEVWKSKIKVVVVSGENCKF